MTTKINGLKFIFIYLISIIVFASVSYSADANFKLNYQGYIKSNGIPINGTQGFKFRIKDGDPGAVQWESSCTDIVVSSGMFRATLGETNDIGSWNTIDWLGIDAHIEVVVGDVGCGSPTTLSPAERLLSNPYSLYASSSTGLQAVDGKLRVTSSTISVSGTDMYLLPPGAIMMWSGTLATIPAGWALCNGTSPTPDLRDRFIYGCEIAEVPGTTGGAVNHNHGVVAHSHTFNTSATTGAGGGNNASGCNGGSGSTDVLSHTHGINLICVSDSASPGTTTADNLPLYYRLAFIMKL